MLEGVKARQDRPLRALYSVVHLEADRQDAARRQLENRVVHIVIGISLEGRKPAPGLWANGHDGTKYWKPVLQNLKNGGLKDGFVLFTYWLKASPEAIEVVFRTRRCRSVLCI